MTANNSSGAHTTRRLWLLSAALFSTTVALITGMLVAASGMDIAESILAGGGAFISTMTLCIKVIHAASPTDAGEPSRRH